MLRMPPSRRIDKFKPQSALPSNATKASESSDRAENSSGKSSITARADEDIEKGALKEQETETTREEAAVVDVIEDVTGILGEVHFEGDEEGTKLPRIVPDNVVTSEQKLTELKSTEKGSQPSTAVTKKPKNKKDKVELDPENVRLYGKKKARKIANGDMVYEDGKGYDMSLVKAIYGTVWLRWWKAVILGLCGCESCTSAQSLLQANAFIEI